MSVRKSTNDRYLVKAVLHSSRVLSAFTCADDTLTLGELTARSQLSKSMVFRMLYTLEHCGLVEKADDRRYRSRVQVVAVSSGAAEELAAET